MSETVAKEGSGCGWILVVSKMKKCMICLVSAICLLFCCGWQLPKGVFPPLKVKMRVSWVRGYVLKITNCSSDRLNCQVYASDGIKQSKTFQFELAGGSTQEVGFRELNGWYLDPGEHAVISVDGYLRPVRVKWTYSGEYVVSGAK